MFWNIDQWKYKVHTPKGDGTIICIRNDERSLTNYATVELDDDKGIYEFNENQLLIKSCENTTKEVKMEGSKKEPLVKDKDVITALECCSSNTHQQEECDKCPFNEIPQTICQNLLAYHALQIIKRENL